MRGVYGLSDALQKIPLAIDNTLRSAGTSGGKQHAGGLVQAGFGGTPALLRGFGQTVQMDDARRWRDALDASKAIVSADDQGRPRILQHLAQPVVWIVGIQGDKGPRRRQASQHRDGKDRTSGQYDADQLSRLGFGRDGFG